MKRILLSVCLLSLSVWPQASRQVAMSRFFITQPAAGSVWLKTKPQMIQWTKVGSMPDKVRIVLSDPALSTLVHVIADPAPNTGSFQWQIPDSVPGGNYKIRIRVLESDINATSHEFAIVQGAVGKTPPLRSITVTGPQDGRRYEPADQVLIEWETDVKDGLLSANDMLYFNIDVYDQDGANKIADLVSAERYDKFYAGGNKYRYKVGFASLVKTGYYKIRVAAQRHNGEGVAWPGFSGKFFITHGTEKVQEILTPQIRDRYSRRMVDTVRSWEPGPEFNSKPGMSRAGYRMDRSPYYGWVGYIFRSQLTFPVEKLREPGKLLLKAQLRLKVTHHLQDGQSPARQSCAGKLYYLTSAWSGDCIETPGYAVADWPNAADWTLDVTQYVQNWYTGSEQNHGFILGSRVEEFIEEKSLWCVSWYEPVLILEFLKGKD